MAAFKTRDGLIAVADYDIESHQTCVVFPCRPPRIDMNKPPKEQRWETRLYERTDQLHQGLTVFEEVA